MTEQELITREFADTMKYLPEDAQRAVRAYIELVRAPRRNLWDGVHDGLQTVQVMMHGLWRTVQAQSQILAGLVALALLPALLRAGLPLAHTTMLPIVVRSQVAAMQASRQRSALEHERDELRDQGHRCSAELSATRGRVDDLNSQIRGLSSQDGDQTLSVACPDVSLSCPACPVCSPAHEAGSSHEARTPKRSGAWAATALPDPVASAGPSRCTIQKVQSRRATVRCAGVSGSFLLQAHGRLPTGLSDHPVAITGLPADLNQRYTYTLSRSDGGTFEFTLTRVER